MSTLVIDASVSLAWLMDDEKAPEAEAARHRLTTDDAFVPVIWHLEMRNGLLVAERRRRLTRRMVDERLGALADLPIRTDHEPKFHRAMDLARSHGMSFYDALYLELALRMSAELATLDTALGSAAAKEGVRILAV